MPKIKLIRYRYDIISKHIYCEKTIVRQNLNLFNALVSRKISFNPGKPLLCFGHCCCVVQDFCIPLITVLLLVLLLVGHPKRLLNRAAHAFILYVVDLD